MPISSPSTPQIQKTNTFKLLTTTPFKGDTNAICWSRNLEGDFAEIVEKVDVAEDIVTLGEEELMALELSEQGQLARKTLLNDLKLLQDYGADPVLNVIRCYERDDSSLAFPTDVYSYHVDCSPVPTDTILCTYHGAASDILPNDQGVQKILVPELREKLRELYGGEEEGFEDFLKENYFDLHYQALPEARPINLGVGHMWRLAIDHPESEVLPCLHRAPLEADGKRRLLMIC
ncbi:hypothetical protein FUA23_05180 [Neolewinella aurantiaca]|uniref:DUF1826 domain-containing protein n=1 Tax=Neolewinella aurantiaca TaxID=2602767 RepID=A0A5C7FLB3_9BACT|nr:hypothetical protein [Neolewinella aurantiaca]TXF90833.1 hypothetical protein FUA23_05180 [Neolewinella aurantiaca]